ncbi:MAG: tyrosine-protein phosphatase [Anaerolineae bacterium]|jgi:protein-tyrosine phosphatase|nr:tyrosine-protein phosphatase [Anaerolineae bacterium]MBT7069706.1 tyrosine-protein phosphatase [Anaerolineae bacterium]MBT7323646.1 tyrosine-protein phosphatase [Anaerolineae bacterium]MBT7599442.1 tyrosine-protein phosphatase [Anaerolineae bacterium]
MEAISNFRDFGGYKTQNGKSLKKGLLYRSGSLWKATSDDLDKLAALGIKTICDLRSEQERRMEPDRIPDVEPITFFNISMRPIVDYHSRSLKRLFSLMFGHERKIDYIEESRKAYRDYATGYLPQFKALLERISNPENLPVLIHCSAGKDRTGVVASLIQQMLGVPPETAMDDYLKTNDNMDQYNADVMQQLSKLAYFGVPWKMFVPLFDARRDYLNAAYTQVKEEFGALDGWMRKGLSFLERDHSALTKTLLM